MNNKVYLCDAIQWDKWTAISTIVLAGLTLLLALAAFLAIWEQRKQFKKQRIDDNERAFKNNSVVLIMDFDKQFYDLEEERAEIAKIIIENGVLEKDSFDYNIIGKGFDTIFDFFDTLAYFVHKEYIKEEVAYQFFDHWFSRYYLFFKLYNIQKISEYGNTVWNNMSELAKRFDVLETEQFGRKRKKINKVDLQKFFEEEAWDGKMNRTSD